MIRIVRVRSRDTLLKPENVELFKRAIESARYPATWPLLLADIVKRIEQPSLAVFYGIEPLRSEDVPRGLAVAMLPDSPWMMAPQVAIVYSQSGRPALLRAMWQALRMWLRDEGHNTVLSVSFRHRPEAWARRFPDAKFRVLGPLIEARF